MKQIKGLYLVLDPSQDWPLLLGKLKEALQAGVGVVQIWNHWQKGIQEEDKISFCKSVLEIAESFSAPVLVNEDWELALKAKVDGVHFDQIPTNWDQVKEKLQHKITGLTVGNDLETIRWADQNQMSYISFCSVFPSSSVDTCELVHPDTIRQAESLTSLPIFLSGGIKPENLHLLQEFSYQGLAVISGILNQEDPKAATQNYLKQMKH